MLCAGVKKRRKISENCNISTFMSKEKKSFRNHFGGKVFSQMKTKKVYMEREEEKIGTICAFFVTISSWRTSRKKSHVFRAAGWMSLVEMAAIKS